MGLTTLRRKCARANGSGSTISLRPIRFVPPRIDVGAFLRHAPRPAPGWCAPRSPGSTARPRGPFMSVTRGRGHRTSNPRRVPRQALPSGPYQGACGLYTFVVPTSPSRQFEKETTMGTRAEQLASKFDQACREINTVVEKLSVEWKKVTSAEKWPVGVVAHHVAGGHAAISGLVQNVAKAASVVQGLGDVEVDRSGTVLAGMPAMTAAQAIEAILLNHVHEHLGSIRA